VRIKVIAGNLEIANQKYSGPIQAGGTEPVYIDVALAANQSLSLPVASSHNAFIYVFEGTLQSDGKDIATHAAALLGSGDTLEVTAGADGGRFLLIAGRPLNEPVAQYGPFVMNTAAEIDQALRDYRDGTLTSGGVQAL
jgi:redox-sensitive bicupin YhaK (pirin superfamily)